MITFPAHYLKLCIYTNGPVGDERLYLMAKKK